MCSICIIARVDKFLASLTLNWYNINLDSGIQCGCTSKRTHEYKLLGFGCLHASIEPNSGQYSNGQDEKWWEKCVDLESDYELILVS